MYPLGPSLAPPLEAGPSLLNLHILSLSLSIDNVTMTQFVHFMIFSQILSCSLILNLQFFSRGFQLWGMECYF